MGFRSRFGPTVSEALALAFLFDVSNVRTFFFFFCMYTSFIACIFSVIIKLIGINAHSPAAATS